MLLRSRSYAVGAAKLATEAVTPSQVVQSGLISQEELALPVAVRSPGSKLSKKRSRTAASAASESCPAAQKRPERPIPTKKTKAKPRKALLNTLWSAEELIPLRAKTEQLYDQLNQLYVDPPCPLDYSTPFQLLVAVILSAQVQAKSLCWQTCCDKMQYVRPSVAL